MIHSIIRVIYKAPRPQDWTLTGLIGYIEREVMDNARI
jgi:hypothetical protein